MRNTGLEETQAGIKIAGRNINKLRYVDDTTLMAENEELKSLLMREESEKFSLKLNIQKTKIMASGPIISWEIDGETVETVSDFILGGSKITADGDCSQSFPGGSEVKASASNAGDPGSIPGSGRSPGEGNGNSLQYSCLENPMDREAQQVIAHGVAKSRTRLSNFTYSLEGKL